jgi:hypothetical protein
MESLSTSYSHQLIYNCEFSHKDKLIFFDNLINCAYNYNKYFKKYNQSEVKNNMYLILNGMKKKYFESSSEEIMYIISAMRLWTRNDLPSFFGFNCSRNVTSYNDRLKIIEKIKSSDSLFV